ncbi:MAG: GntR family transcriptional regulator [Solirubrobacteraceae bacterium]
MKSRRRQSLVEQVRQDLMDDLIDGTLERGAKLPSESDLAEQFEVSRATVREAVLGLLDQGLLTRRHGSGTYVTTIPRSRHALEATVSYTAMIREAGHEPGEIVMSKKVRPTTGSERGLLELTADQNVMEVERVRLADRRPVIYSRDRIPEHLLSSIAHDALDSSLYVVLDWAGHAVARAAAELLPTVADASTARLLEIKRGAPLLHIDQVDYDKHGLAVLLSEDWHVADAFQLIVNRRSHVDDDV